MALPGTSALLRPASAGITLFWFVACGGGATPSPVASPPPPTPPPAQRAFSNVTQSSGMVVRNAVSAVPVPAEISIILPSAAAAGDYDNDGDIDVFIVRGDVSPNLLYRNLGNLVFEDVAAQAGVAMTGAAGTENYYHGAPMFADIDGDDDLDLFVGGLAGDPSGIYKNNGDGTFSDVTAGSGLDAMQAPHSLSAAFGDYDLDGDLDLFIAHWGTPHDYTNPGDTEHLWRNDTDAGGIRFTSVSEFAGISPSILTLPDPRVSQVEEWDFTFAPAFARIDDDLYPDILSVADFNKSMYFVNNRDGTFRNATDTDVIIDNNGMGSAVGDYDNDGDLDWFVTAIKCKPGSGNDCIVASHIGNRLYRNDGGMFVDASSTAGIADGGWGWAACFLDFENDGDLDIYHTNGWPFADDFNDFSFDTSRAFVNDGGGRFTDNAGGYGIADTEQGRGVVCADFDDDGDVDILLLHRGRNNAVTLWRNDHDDNNYLAVRLRGLAPNTGASGARIFLDVGGDVQMREISIASNFVSQNPARQVFGMGAASQADRLTIEWPDGRQSEFVNVAAGQLLVFEHPDRP